MISYTSGGHAAGFASSLRLLPLIASLRVRLFLFEGEDFPHGNQMPTPLTSVRICHRSIQLTSSEPEGQHVHERCSSAIRTGICSYRNLLSSPGSLGQPGSSVLPGLYGQSCVMLNIHSTGNLRAHKNQDAGHNLIFTLKL